MSEREYVIEKAFRLPSKKKVGRFVRQVGMEMDPKRNAGDKIMGRIGLPRIGEGGAAMGAARGMRGYAPEIARGLRGLAGR